MEESQSAVEAESRKGSIKGWTKEEKYFLLQALKAFGSHDIKKIQEFVSTKSLEETKAAIDHYIQIAMRHPIFEKKRQVQISKSMHKPHLPLTQWAKLLTDSLNFNELRTETTTALRMIAELENIPPPVCTDEIDFRQVYHQLANATEGKAMILDYGTTTVLNKCLVETALSSKAFIKTSAYKFVINSIDLSHKEINSFPRPTEDSELATLRHLAAQRSYNPLMVPEDYLKPLCNTNWDEVHDKKD